MSLTKRFIVSSLDGIPLSNPIRYERYYINDNCRIQKKENNYGKEILDDKTNSVQHYTITENEFIRLKKSFNKKNIRDSYLYLKDDRISIKKYYDGLNRIEVIFLSKKVNKAR